MSEPIPYISCVKNLFVKQMRFSKAGDKEKGHAHIHDHLTLLTKGKLRVNALGKDTDFDAPAHIYIKADVVHELIALEDDTIAHCIHALRNEDGSGDILDPASIPEGVAVPHEPLTHTWP